MQVIGIYSPYPGAGKSTLAARLNMRYGYARMKMAGPLKEMLRAYLHGQGLYSSQIEDMIEGSAKHEPHVLLNGKTPRHAMQTLGTEWGRNCMGEDFWVEAAAEQIEHALKNGLNVVVDDVRFPNEMDMIRDLGGIVVRIRRPALEKANRKPWYHRWFSTGHASEGSLDHMVFDMEITNGYTDPQEFACAEAERIVNKMYWPDVTRNDQEKVKPFIGS